MKIVMIGSGNTATVLCALFHKSGHEIAQVVSRKIENARELASLYHCPAETLAAPEFQPADYYIIALHDAALDHLGKFLALQNKFLIHTAGAVSINALKNYTSTYGVLYPLQTLSKYAPDVAEIPFLVDGNNKESIHHILGLARSISSNVLLADDSQRLHYHVAAVFASNFANHMYALAELYCQKEKIDFKNILPLINEVNKRVASYSPFQTQTGPAMRDDIFTLNRHLQALSSHPDLKYIYVKMSESIIKVHGKR